MNNGRTFANVVVQQLQQQAASAAKVLLVQHNHRIGPAQVLSEVLAFITEFLGDCGEEQPQFPILLLLFPVDRL